MTPQLLTDSGSLIGIYVNLQHHCAVINRSITIPRNLPYLKQSSVKCLEQILTLSALKLLSILFILWNAANGLSIRHSVPFLCQLLVDNEKIILCILHFCKRSRLCSSCCRRFLTFLSVQLEHDSNAIYTQTETPEVNYSKCPRRAQNRTRSRIARSWQSSEYKSMIFQMRIIGRHGVARQNRVRHSRKKGPSHIPSYQSISTTRFNKI